ncbi:Transcription elongation factor 1 [Homalodisca vitripennis]|nr:Transcription elongation factor 1 [Homalodisca vitripennis]
MRDRWGNLPLAIPTTVTGDDRFLPEAVGPRPRQLPCFYRIIRQCVIMGRRKSNRKPPPKRKAVVPLPVEFNCPFCNVTMDRGRRSGRIACRVCFEDFQTTIHFLTEPIDVYNDWIDACETAN